MFECSTPLTLRAFLKEKGNLITAINKVEAFPFLEGEVATQSILVINYGSRTLFSAFKDEDLDTIASHLVSIYGERWKSLVKSLANIDDLAASRITKSNETEVSTDTSKDDSETQHKVSGFNSDELITDTADSINSNGSKNGTNDVEGLVTVYDYRTLLNNLTDSQINGILSYVAKDIASYLTISIY